MSQEELENTPTSVVSPIEEQVSEPTPLPVLEKDEVLKWEPTAEITITGEQFGILNMCMRQVIGKMKNFSFEDFLQQSPEFSLVFTARKTCEDIVAKMKEDGIATAQKK
jgi:hypothetical protein